MKRLLVWFGVFALVFIATTVLYVRPGEAQSGGVTYPPDLGRVSGVLPVANGGTGVSTLASNQVLYGNGASNVLLTGGGINGGSILFRQGSGVPAWSAQPQFGVNGVIGGQLTFAGATSGSVIIAPQAAAGTPTLALPTGTGTLAVTASAPIVLNATTGNLTLNSIDLTSQVTGVLPPANGGSAGAAVNSFCNGTIGTANATTYFVTPGGTGATSTVCTMTGGVEMPMPMACTAKNLYVSVGTAGSAAGSTLVKLFVNGSGSTLTCTAGTATTCNDTTHTVAITAGQGWSIRVTTGQATDTTANIRVAFQCQ